jgi:hypothetical protein
VKLHNKLVLFLEQEVEALEPVVQVVVLARITDLVQALETLEQVLRGNGFGRIT